MNRCAIFPGTFDPFTVGHASVVKRTLTFMDEVIIGIAVSESKHTFYNIDERTAMIHRYYANEPRIKVTSYDDLTVDLALRYHAGFIVRGIRTVKDFEYEETMADINRKLTGVETILLFTEPELTCVSSTMVRELLHFGKEVGQFIPEGMKLMRIDN
ncbi:MAG: pantetheine-phosphate adenylyltransferase [Prevotellaceae bacterium]|jgi:pantetheine-phosphate adenylyltransferase|nr:pantetheine-phosphate adenylyltransferase [Prevotellaceae bacterium]